jgi:hypothetical protein
MARCQPVILDFPASRTVRQCISVFGKLSSFWFSVKAAQNRLTQRHRCQHWHPQLVELVPNAGCRSFRVQITVVEATFVLMITALEVKAKQRLCCMEMSCPSTGVEWIWVVALGGQGRGRSGKHHLYEDFSWDFPSRHPGRATQKTFIGKAWNFWTQLSWCSLSAGFSCLNCQECVPTKFWLFWV